MKKRKLYVRFFCTEVFFSGVSTVPVDNREISGLNIEDDVFGFYFFETDLNEDRVKRNCATIGREFNVSPFYFYDAVLMTIKEIEKAKDISSEDKRVILDKMKSRGQIRIVKDRHGRFRPYLDENDNAPVFLSSTDRQN